MQGKEVCSTTDVICCQYCMSNHPSQNQITVKLNKAVNICY